MNLFIGLIKGYYYPSRKAGLSRIKALFNATNLAWKCLNDQYNRPAPTTNEE